jgi:hypothetical protein
MATDTALPSIEFTDAAPSGGSAAHLPPPPAAVLGPNGPAKPGTGFGRLPLVTGGGPGDEELYKFWSDHVKNGLVRNDEMFRRILNAFMKPYYATVWMYGILFAVGVLSFIAAAALSVYYQQPMYAMIFGGLSVVAFLGYFIGRPLRSLEENLEFITWLGIIYNTYWSRVAYALDRNTVQKDLHDAVEDAAAQIERLIDKHGGMSSKRPGASE